MTQFGPYTVTEKLGRGAMGMVYHAVDADTGREVALKILKARRAASAEALEAFRNEARVAAGLKHPNIVPIHTFGDIEGKHYYTMDFVDGFPLTKLIDDDVITPDESARVAADLAGALHYAHEKGVIHSDIKPANILMDAEAVPLIADFGLARKAGRKEKEETILEGQGTPAYMSPEQASGAADIGPTTDVYSLGAVLFEMLTGRPPYEGKTANDVMLQAAKGQPPPPSRFNPFVPGDLEAVVRKAMARDPADRYPTAEAMEQDLRRYLRGERVGARPRKAALVRAFRSLRRNSGFVFAGAVLALLGPFLLVFGLRKAGAPPPDEVAREQAVSHYLAAADLYLEKDRPLEADRLFTLAERQAGAGPGRVLVERRRLAFEDNRRSLASRYVSQGFEKLEEGDFEAVDRILSTLAGLSFDDEPLQRNAEMLRENLARTRREAKADEEAYRKVRETVADTRDRSVLAHAWRAYLAAHPGGRHAGEAHKTLEGLYPLFVPGVDLDEKGERFFNARDRTELAFVPAGTFSMGYRDGYTDERPVHEVKLGGYYIYRHEVTREGFARFLNDYGALTDEDNRPLLADDISSVLRRDAEGTWSCPDGESELPMVRVTWFGAQAYARWAEGSLPSEAQWEKAARGRANTLYPWGEEWRWDVLNSLSYWAKEDIRTYDWGSGMSEERRSQIYLSLRPLKAGLFPDGASDYGCLNMAGNVKEWCLDSHEKEYYAQLEGTAEDPVNLLETGYKTVRGGSYLSIAKDCRTTMRSRKEPGKAADDIGFRCVMAPLR